MQAHKGFGGFDRTPLSIVYIAIILYYCSLSSSTATSKIVRACLERVQIACKTAGAWHERWRANAAIALLVVMIEIWWVWSIKMGVVPEKISRALTRACISNPPLENPSYGPAI